MTPEETTRPEMGYGHEKWQSPEVTAEKALEELKSLDEDAYNLLIAMIQYDLKPGRIHEGAVFSHINQVDSIGLLIAESSGLFINREERLLVELEFLLHDISKQPNPISLKTHAYEGARDLTKYVKNIQDVERPEGVTQVFKESFKGHKNLQRFLENCDNTLDFLSRCIETHSDIPFINDLEKYVTELKINGEKVEKPFENYQWLNRVPDENRPYLQEKNIDEKQYFGLPEPFDKYSKLLRAADTLSNYAVLPDLEIGALDMTAYEAKYAGFIKLLTQSRAETHEEKIDNIIATATDAINYGVYTDFPHAQKLAEESIERMRWLKEYWKDKPEPTEAEDKKREYQKMFELLEERELEKSV